MPLSAGQVQCPGPADPFPLCHIQSGVDRSDRPMPDPGPPRLVAAYSGPSPLPPPPARPQRDRRQKRVSRPVASGVLLRGALIVVAVLGMRTEIFELTAWLRYGEAMRVPPFQQ